MACSNARYISYLGRMKCKYRSQRKVLGLARFPHGVNNCDLVVIGLEGSMVG